jgi:hypothetical protein
MSPDDPRHGTNAGYIAGCRKECCRTPSSRYSKRLKYEHLQGRRRTVESWRAVRRLDALACLGWSRGAVAAAMGVKHKCQIYAIGSHPRVYAETFEKLDAVYRDLSMRLPVAETLGQRTGITKTRNNALRRGAVPPLGWDDIDTDPEPPTAEPEGPWEDQVDHAVVRRVLDSGTRPRQLTRAEATEIVHTLIARGHSTTHIEDHYGFKTDRYTKEVA